LSLSMQFVQYEQTVQYLNTFHSPLSIKNRRAVKETGEKLAGKDCASMRMTYLLYKKSCTVDVFLCSDWGGNKGLQPRREQRLMLGEDGCLLQAFLHKGKLRPVLKGRPAHVVVCRAALLGAVLYGCHHFGMA